MLPHNQKFIVFDTETEGLNLHSSRPWQISWIVCQGNRIIETHDEYVDHKNLQLSDIVKRLTGFTWEKYIVVGQNLLGFDVYMISELQRLLGEEPNYSYLPRIYDTRALGKAYREELDRPKGNLLSWQYKIINDRSLKAKVSQNQLLKFFSIDFEESKLHNALYDIKMCFKVFLELKKNMNL